MFAVSPPLHRKQQQRNVQGGWMCLWEEAQNWQAGVFCLAAGTFTIQTYTIISGTAHSLDDSTKTNVFTPSVLTASVLTVSSYTTSTTPSSYNLSLTLTKSFHKME